MLKRGIAVAGAAAALLVAGSAPAQAASCVTEPTYDPAVPTPQSVLGFPLGIGQPQPVTSEQILRDLLRALRGQGVRLRAAVL